MPFLFIGLLIIFLISCLKVKDVSYLFDAFLISVCLCREDVYIKSESPSRNMEQGMFPEHNCTNILKVIQKCLCSHVAQRKQNFTFFQIIHCLVVSPAFLYAVPVLLYGPVSTGVQRRRAAVAANCGGQDGPGHSAHSPVQYGTLPATV